MTWARNSGKSELARIRAEQLLNQGKTVAFISLVDGKVVVDVRGAGVAKDVTPPKPKQLERR